MRSLRGRALLLRDDGNGPPVDTTETGDNGLIVGKLAIPVQLEERWRKHLDVELAVGRCTLRAIWTLSHALPGSASVGSSASVSSRLPRKRWFTLSMPASAPF